MALTVRHVRVLNIADDITQPELVQPTEWGSTATVGPTHIVEGTLDPADIDLSGYVLTGDARLSDARVPLAHTQAFSTLTGLPSTLAGYGIPAVTKADLGLGVVENTALSTWAGSANLVTLGPFVVNGTEVVLTADSFRLKVAGAGNGVVIQMPRPATDNTFFGLLAGNATATGIDNCAFGSNCLPDLTIGDYNTAIGQSALWKVTTGSNNTAIGVAASRYLLTGLSNTAVGFHALYLNDVNGSVAVGAEALALSTAARNVAVGYQSMKLLAGGADNTSVGTYSGSGNLAGSNNTLVGYFAGGALLGSRNVCLGSNAGFYETGSDALYIDNATRASLADGKVKALIYGVFGATVAAQSLALNATVAIAGDLTVAGAGGVTMTGALRVADGTALLPGMAFASEPSLGFRRSGAGTITGQAALIVTGSITSGNNVSVAAAAALFWATSTEVRAPASGKLNITNTGNTIGVGVDVLTDAVLKIRTRAQTGYATVDALGYSVSGAAGASKAAGPVTSITVVNGIVTAIS